MAPRFDVSRKFGVEMEIAGRAGVSTTAVSDALNAAGIETAVEGYNHENRPHWKIVPDGSVCGPCPFELVSPILRGTEGLDEIRKVCAVLNRLGLKVNKSCGLHVHHDATDLGADDLKAVLTGWWKYEEVTSFLVPPSRRAGFYCRPIQPSAAAPAGYRFAPRGVDLVESFKSFLATIRDRSTMMRAQVARFCSVNFHALSAHNTVEFRSHSGTTDADKIVAWVALTQFFITKAKATGFKVGARMTGAYALEIRHFWKCIGWLKLECPILIAAKALLTERFNSFRNAGAEGVEAPIAREGADGRPVVDRVAGSAPQVGE